MDRAEFETLRDLPGKLILGDICLTCPKDLSPSFVADNIKVTNDLGLDARISISFNPETGSKTINVHVPGIGPICRLDVDGRRHGNAGRNHKHSLQTSECPSLNLSNDVISREELAGKALSVVFIAFCRMANIEHNGALIIPSIN